MHTDTTVRRTVPQSEPKADVRPDDGANDLLPLTQALTPEQVRVIDQLLSPLDRANAPVRMGFFAPKAADRSMVLEYLVRPGAARKMRTPEHRKVVGLRLDATAIPEGMQPWHYLVLSVIELLTESAMPSERTTLSELRNEMTRLVRLHRRDAAAGAQASVPFARRFQTTFPKLVLNTVSLANSVLLIVLDHVDETNPGDTAQWLEASQFFCSAAGSTVMLSANEIGLLERLNESAVNANGRVILQSWMTRRVEFPSASGVVPERPAPAPASQSVHETTQHIHDNAGRAGRQLDMPAASARIIREALQPDTSAIISATAQWRAATHAILRRTEEGLGGSIPATLIAKLVALRALAPSLYDAARYDAQMLTAIERSARGDASSDAHTEWTSQIRQQPKLAALLTVEPAFASVELRDLATALRVTNAESGSDADALPADSATLRTGASARQRAMEAAGSSVSNAAHTLFAAAQAAEGRMLISSTLLTTAFAGAGVFLVDRIMKLLIQSALNEPGRALLGGLVKPEVLSANTVTGTFWGGGMAVGAELFGLALAVLIALFWGGARQQSSHAIGLGLIIGALGANLFDRLAYGGVLNYFHIANLPVFNLSHVALLAGALLVAFSLLRATRSNALQVPG